MTATAASDYVASAVALTFPGGSSNGARQCVNITITPDTEMEGDETFTVTLTTSSLTAELGNTVTNITITKTPGEAIPSLDTNYVEG